MAVKQKRTHKTKRGKYGDWITPEGLTKLEGFARDGLTDEQIAHNAGIHVATLYEWKKAYPEVDEALKKGKEVIDREVENALLKRALGYKFEEVTSELKPFFEKGKKAGLMMVETKRIIKEVAPDPTAQIFWLKNRKPDVWRDRKELDVSSRMVLFEDVVLDE